MKTALFLSMLLVTGSLLARNLDKTFQLLPQPQSVEIQAGKGLDYGELSYVVADGEAPIPVLGAITNGLPQSERAGKGIHFRLSQTGVPDSPEGYLLEITGKGGDTADENNGLSGDRLPCRPSGYQASSRPDGLLLPDGG